MNIREYMKQHRLLLDGSMGTLLQAQGLAPGELPETWNITHPEKIRDIHRRYYDAGSHVVSTNTFGANRLKFAPDQLEDVIRAAIDNARQAAALSHGPQEKWVALDIGPTGKMLAPYGDFDFEEAVAVFADTVKLGVKYGVDLLFIETMNDCYETKAALLAAKENSDLPVFVSNAYGEDGKLMTGADPAVMVALLEGMGADAIGVNCSLGPAALAPVVEQYVRLASVPVLCKPNAGLPAVHNGQTVYNITPDMFVKEIAPLLEQGVGPVGGCCGTTPAYIEALATVANRIPLVPITQKTATVVTSYTKAVDFAEAPILIGERINPTGKKRFKEALLANDMDYILQEGIAQQEKGVHILDVNVGLPEIDEVAMLTTAVGELQGVVDVPLQIDTSNSAAMEAALRRYNGKAMINSVHGKQESMDAVLPMVKKYGGVVVALTLDEQGIPKTAEERVAIARRIVKEAAGYGIAPKDIVFDPLALTVSADNTVGVETLRAVTMIKKELGCHTSLGVSNISFGLPYRDGVNSTFFAMALAGGLSAAIMNPYALDMQKVYYAYRALIGKDDNCGEYIAFAQDLPRQTVAAPMKTNAEPTPYGSDLQRAIIKGLKEQAAQLTSRLLDTVPPLDIIQQDIIPALNTVGSGFEQKTVYLPQLLMSAEAAKAAFACIKERLKGDAVQDKGPFVLATVHGDIHDIGKNIVKLLLENYGFRVVDLGRDVPPQRIVDEVVALHAPLAGLSALMTTTVPAMEDTIRLLKDRAPWCQVVVGGAVLTREYAAAIGAHHYAKDAMETVRYAQEIIQ